MRSVSISLVKPLLLLSLMLTAAVQMWAASEVQFDLAPTLDPPYLQSTLKVYLTTGSDDLRGGNAAYLTVHYTDGSSSFEFALGGGYKQNSTKTIPINLRRSVANVSAIKSITVRHDGSPRAGQPFDSYDNWDLQSIRVALVLPNGEERNVINLTSNPVVRFTGELRTQTWLRQ